MLEHAANLLLQYLGLGQLTLVGDGQQFVIGHGSPEKVRQPHRQFMIAHVPYPHPTLSLMRERICRWFLGRRLNANRK